MIRNIILITAAPSSAAIIENHMPFRPNSVGRISTQPVWKIIVLENDTMAEMIPLLSDVKNAEINIGIPINKNENADITKACTVMS